MTYQESITRDMSEMAKDSKTLFIGEGLINAGRVYGTLNGVPMSQCIEMPICENLIASMAIGLAITGYKPIVIFQRMDFMLLASDAIINHIALIPKMSGQRICLPIIIRAIIGSQDPSFDLGPQHSQDHRHIFSPYLSTEDYYAKAYQLHRQYALAPGIIVEAKDKYKLEMEESHG